MTFIVIGSFIHLAIPVLSEEKNIYLIKRKGPKGYFYYNGAMDQQTLFSYLKKILKTKLSPIYVLEVYGMYNGMMDVSPYLPKEVKDNHPYYCNPRKELSVQELDAFLTKNHLK